MQALLCVATKGVKNVNAEKNVHPAVASVVSKEAPVQEKNYIEKNYIRYTSDSYQKILDYHVSEILLTTIIFGIILLLRFHR